MDQAKHPVGHTQRGTSKHPLLRGHPEGHKHPDGHKQASKGQSSIMEYLLLSFFILLIIVALIFFFSWWQFSQLGMEERNIENQRIILLMDRLSNSPLLVKENSVFDDSKLQTFQGLANQGFCNDLEGIFGMDWYLEIEILNRPEHPDSCHGINYYPQCSSWSIVCGVWGERNVSLVLPVNVFRKLEGRTDLGLMRVGVYQ